MENLYYFAAKLSAGDIGISDKSANSVLEGVLSTAYFAAGMIAVIVIIVSGFFYITSQGDSSKVKRAKDGILYSVVGLIVVITAFLITNFLIGRF